jgi:hypothetical protein
VAKSNVNAKLSDEVRRLTDELHEVQRRTDNQALSSGALSAAADEEALRLTTMTERTTKLEAALGRLHRHNCANLEVAYSKGTYIRILS